VKNRFINNTIRQLQRRATVLTHSLQDPARSTNDFRSALKTHLFAAQRDD